MDSSLFQPDLQLNDFLHKMAIDEAITALLMTRPIPKDNLYWKGQTCYVDGKVRFLSIPFWLQLCNQNGYSLDLLLREDNLQVMEQILHYSEEEEQEQITWEQCIAKCYAIPAVQKAAKKSPSLITALNTLVHNYPAYSALRRGNFLVYHALLFVSSKEEGLHLCHLLLDMIICGCIIDDLYDAHEDRDLEEENIIIELGDDLDALNQARTLFYASLNRLQPYLPSIHSYLEYTFNQIIPHYLFHTITP